MVRTRAVLLVLTLAAIGSTPVAAATCTGASIASGSCSVGGGTTDGGVDLWGDITSGGSGSPGGSAVDPNECPNPVGDRCLGTSPPKDTTEPTTVHDIASFRPETPRQFSEPLGWTLRHIPTNFVAVSARHIVSGELLGAPADVRFTPVSYSRTYGDGAHRTTGSPGSTWADLGQPWWTRTPTSHSYAGPGIVTVRLTVWFEAEYRFGNQEWHPLAGWVSAHANTLEFAVLAADTVLVERTCDTAALGCATAR